MIEDLVILNYKSIKEAQFTCRKLNILIGPPNTGKSNILEGVGLFTLFNNECKITELVRFQTMHNLFYDNNIENPVHIRTNTHRLKIQFKENFEVYVETKSGTTLKSYDLYYDQTGKLLNSHPHYTSPVNMYKFKPESVFNNKTTGHLKPPHGDNLVLMLLKDLELRKAAAEVFQPFGYKLVINPLDSSIELQKESEGIVIVHPYTLASPMLQRFVFHLAAIETNKDGVVIFEEPESYASTGYMKKIVEEIAANANSQYFISSHNPNFLAAVLKSLPADEVKIYYVDYYDYQTRVQALIEEDYDMIQKQDMDVISRIGVKLSGRVEG